MKEVWNLDSSSYKEFIISKPEICNVLQGIFNLSTNDKKFGSSPDNINLLNFTVYFTGKMYMGLRRIESFPLKNPTLVVIYVSTAIFEIDQ